MRVHPSIPPSLDIPLHSHSLLHFPSSFLLSIHSASRLSLHHHYRPSSSPSLLFLHFFSPFDSLSNFLYSFIVLNGQTHLLTPKPDWNLQSTCFHRIQYFYVSVCRSGGFTLHPSVHPLSSLSHFLLLRILSTSLRNHELHPPPPRLDIIVINSLRQEERGNLRLLLLPIIVVSCCRRLSLDTLVFNREREIS